MKQRLFILLITTIISFTLPAQVEITAQDLTIEVDISGINLLKGNLRIAIYSESNDFPSTSDILDFQIIPVKNVLEIIKFKVQSQGKYAIAVLHDISKNGVMDFNLVGYPKEPYGFSNNPGIWYRKPTFAECSFGVSADTIVNIKL